MGGEPSQLKIETLVSLSVPLPHPPPPCDRAKLEKERKEKSRQLGLIRTEGSDGGEDMERERRTFQLQMCEVGGLVPVKIPAPDTFHIPEVGSVQPARVVFLWEIPYFYPRSTAPFQAPGESLAKDKHAGGSQILGRVMQKWVTRVIKGKMIKSLDRADIL